MNGSEWDFKLKGDKAEEPAMYLSDGINKMTTGAGDICWAILSEKYYRAAVQNVEDDLKKKLEIYLLILPSIKHPEG